MQDFALLNLIQKGAKTRVFEPGSGKEKSRPGDASHRTTFADLAAMPFLPAIGCMLFSA
jgi:hypothetical protein